MMIIEIVTEWRLRELEKHRKLRDEGFIEVTDLMRCPLKREFEVRYPDLYRASAYTPATILGSLVHIGLESILSNELNAEIEVRGEKTIGEHRIFGKIDAKVGKVGIEIKTSRADFEIPYEHHILQAKIYNWLFDLDKTILVYITPDRVTEFIVDERVDEDEILKMIVDKTTPKYDWECRYCHFSLLCPSRKKK
ncbi:MAG: CRISPR-associated protein Cas4 [Archaeoglobales archaeon]|nr:MAG: CRISPR-associated protein Cas4 [Archaeoglobales archaeon]